MENQKKRSVIVIGAGMAGITAARELTDQGNYVVTVLEADPKRYGGRMYSYRVPGTDKSVDLGAMFIHGGIFEDHPIVQLCRRYGVQISHYDDHVIWMPGKVVMFDENGKPWSPEKLDEYSKVIEKFEEILVDGTRQMVDFDTDVSVRTYLNEVAKKNPDFMNHEAITQVAIPSFEEYMAALIDDMSLKLMHGIPDNLERVVYEDGDLWIPTGYGSLLDKMITTDSRFTLHLDRRVERVQINSNRANIEITCSDSKSDQYRYTADYVIVAVPLGILKSRCIHFDPELPPEHMRAIDRIGIGVRTKVVLIYDRQFWPDHAVMCVQSKTWPRFLLNLKKLHDVNGIMISYDERGSISTEYMTDEALLNLAVQQLATLFDQIRDARLLNYKIIRWGMEPHVRGAYSYGKIGMTREDAYAIRKPIWPYLFFAGEHTTYPDCIPGTVLAAHMSGKRAAQEIMKVNDQKDMTGKRSKL